MWAAAINTQTKCMTDKQIITESMVIGSLINERLFTDPQKGTHTFLGKERLSDKASSILKNEANKKSKSLFGESIERINTYKPSSKAIFMQTSLEKRMRTNFQFNRKHQDFRPEFSHRSEIDGDPDEPNPNSLSLATVENSISKKPNRQVSFWNEDSKALRLKEIELIPKNKKSMHKFRNDDKYALKKSLFRESKKQTNPHGDEDICDNMFDSEATDHHNFDGKADDENDHKNMNDANSGAKINIRGTYEDESDYERENIPKARVLFYERARKIAKDEKRIGGILDLFTYRPRFLTIFTDKPKLKLPLTPEHMNIFNDCSSYMEPGKISYAIAKRSTTKTSSATTTQTFEGQPTFAKRPTSTDLYIIRPDSRIRLSWDIFCGLLIIYQIMIIPLRVSFDLNDDSQNIFEIFDYLIDSIFLLDILLNFNTGYQSKGATILIRGLIVRNYLKGYFWMDLLSTFPYSYAINIETENGSANHSKASKIHIIKMVRLLRFLKILRLLRVVKLKKIYAKIENLINTSAFINAILGFMKITAIILIIAHWIACIWHFIGSFELDQSPVTWISNIGLTDAPWTEKYITSIYWAITTMITVGYGDITPVTELEMIIVIITELISSIVFAFSMNSINSLLTNMDSSTIAYRQTLSTVHHYMKKRMVSDEVQLKVRRYLEYILDNESSKVDEENLLELLSENLRQELIAEINVKTLSASKIFTDKFSPRFLTEVSFIMKEQLFGADELIFREDNTEDLGIYFILSGEVQIFSLDSNACLQKLEKDKYFGELAFFSGMKRIASARSAAFTELRYIARDDFIKLLEQFPREREIYCMIKDQINLYGNYEGLQISCYSCNKKGHVTIKCPQIHYEIEHSMLLHHFIEAEYKFRNHFHRVKTKTKVYGNYLEQLRKAAERIQNVFGDTPFLANNYNDPNNNSSQQLSVKQLEHAPTNTNPNNFVDSKQLNIPLSRNESDLLVTDSDSKSSNQKGNGPVQNPPIQPVIMEKIEKPIKIICSEENDEEFSIDHICNYRLYFPNNNFKSVMAEIMENKRLREHEARLLLLKSMHREKTIIMKNDRIIEDVSVNEEEEEGENIPLSALTADKIAKLPLYTNTKTNTNSKHTKNLINLTSFGAESRPVDFRKISQISKEGEEINSMNEQCKEGPEVITHYKLQNSNSNDSKTFFYQKTKTKMINENMLNDPKAKFAKDEKIEFDDIQIDDGSNERRNRLKDPIENLPLLSDRSINRIDMLNTIETVEKCVPLLEKMINYFGEDFLQNIIKQKEGKQ